MFELTTLTTPVNGHDHFVVRYKSLPPDQNKMQVIISEERWGKGRICQDSEMSFGRGEGDLTSKKRSWTYAKINVIKFALIGVIIQFKLLRIENMEC